MNITTLTVGQLQAKCYLVSDEEHNTIIIDPGDESEFISATILENKLKPQAILLTHGHYDHCLAAPELQLIFNIPIFLHPKDLFLYKNTHKSHSYWNKSKPKNTLSLPSTTQDLPSTLSFGGLNVQVLQSPGHTPGSTCFLVSSTTSDKNTNFVLFTGDTLFKNSTGTANHKYSSKTDLKKSLKYLISTINNLPRPHLIYPGHEDFGFSLPTQKISFSS